MFTAVLSDVAMTPASIFSESALSTTRPAPLLRSSSRFLISMSPSESLMDSAALVEVDVTCRSSMVIALSTFTTSVGFSPFSTIPRASESSIVVTPPKVTLRAAVHDDRIAVI